MIGDQRTHVLGGKDVARGLGIETDFTPMTVMTTLPIEALNPSFSVAPK
jgi:hypothetical protein